MYLIDTNVFLEILLDQENRRKCEGFLLENRGSLFISDFSLHSIGVVLFRHDREEAFQTFMAQFDDLLQIISLPAHRYTDLGRMKVEHGLDFDDAYQCAVAEEFGLRIVTMDAHFKFIQPEMEVVFL
jgi:predicted nucleic acid-binding protein